MQGKLDKLKNLLKDKISVDSFSCESAVPFKSFDFINALFWRIEESITSTYKLLNEDEINSSRLICKSMLESLAILWHIHMKIESLIFTKNMQNFEKELKAILFEYRDKELIDITLNLVSINPKIKEIYEYLLEYSYANFNGTHGLYSKMNMQEYYIQYAKDINEDKLQSKEKILFVLTYSIDLFEDLHKKINNKQTEFIEIFK